MSRLNSDHAHAAYRIAQEALNNAFKHAQAKHIRIEATLQASLNPEQADTFKLSITDDGVGRQDKAIDPSRWGIKGMQERVQALGGQWALHDHEPQGLTLVAMWEVA